MPRQKESYTAQQAARALGISLDTLRRWDRAGRIRTARNRFTGVVRSIEVDGLLAQVEIDVTEPARAVAIITRAAAEELGLREGMRASAVVKATSVMVER